MEKRNRKSPSHNNAKASQANGLDVEYSSELADQDDLEAQARAQAADRRQKNGRR
ncbi:YfhD family protein [Fictibacillus phosphorivorans]|uniref:YfhD family protein n=1 Tax=Fictibacillus phosphorivorans TaxID=1221500 RepID=UPI000AFB7028|nr:YfhD family protein [Fictibacillus phosphorivorans]